MMSSRAQKKHDYKELLKAFTGELFTVLKVGALVNLTVEKLSEIMKLENAAILLYDRESGEFRITASTGLPKGVECSFPSAHDASMKKKLQAKLIIPIKHSQDILGALSLGNKKSDKEFTQDDMDILLPLARTLSIAITNARLFEELSGARAYAAQSEKMVVIGTLLASINHEICNPLGIARGQCEAFLLSLREGLYRDKDPAELVDKAKEIMHLVIKQTDRAAAITRKLSAFAKPAEGKIEDNVEVEKELDEVVSLVEQDLKLNNIRIRKEIQEGLPVMSADRKQIQEIFFNLLRNSAQAIRGGGEILVKAVSKDKKIYIDVKDTGVGMNRNELFQMFNPFFTTRESGGGTGLGLFIVKQIVEKNNGRISVESEPGKGTCFHLVFDAAG